MAGILAITTGVAGCVDVPLIRDAASAYGKTTEDAALSVGNEPASIATSCQKRARLAYLENRLQHEKLSGIALIGTFDEFFTAAEAIPANPTKSRPALSYKAYCSALDDASKPYQDAVGALSRYGAALAKLSGKSSVKIGDDVATIANSAGTFASLASGNDVTDAAQVVATQLKDFANLLVQQRVAEDVSAYVIAADPKVQKVLDGMIQYDNAVGQEVKALRAAVRRDITSVEGLYHLAGAAPITPPQSASFTTPKPVSTKPTADTADVRADIDALRKDLQAELTAAQARDEALRRELQSTKPAQFFELAESLDREALAVEDEYGKYREVLVKWKAAHTDLVKVAQTDDKNDLAALLGTVGDLATRMKDIQALIQGGKK
jgi:hypothetical protein